MQKKLKLFEGCLLACDVDGTLIDNGLVCKRNVEKINFFMKEGGIFALSTGRAPFAIVDILSAIPDISLSVMENGALIYDFKGDKAVFETVICDEAKSAVSYIYDHFKNVGIEVYSGKNSFLLNRTDGTDIHQRYEKYETTELDIDLLLKYNWNKVFFVPDENELDAVHRFLLKYEAFADIYVTSAYIENRERLYCEMTPKNVTKHSGNIKLCEIMKIKKGCYYAIGDYNNDLEMLTSADISATLCTSPEEIKQKSDVVVGNVQNGAVADFIEYLTDLRKDK